MFKVDETTGNIELVQGDSGEFEAVGVPTDKNYEVYFGFRDENRRLIGFELMAYSGYQPIVPFKITPSLTNLLTVPLGEETATYYHYVKICYKDDDFEDTQQIGNLPIGENTTTVKPQGLEGTNNNG